MKEWLEGVSWFNTDYETKIKSLEDELSKYMQNSVSEPKPILPFDLESKNKVIEELQK